MLSYFIEVRFLYNGTTHCQLTLSLSRERVSVRDHYSKQLRCNLKFSKLDKVNDISQIVVNSVISESTTLSLIKHFIKIFVFHQTLMSTLLMISVSVSFKCS
jgi:hypothetical protein